ncbi:uncharacterized protein N0V89_006685 [Didymosphaeria variabile]|uniref:Heterokaryon incompatibility domain-containing protein n=1 Tax=Didymosphaeria variabile TaxID=1932322 RepID=A0A9W8XHJ7_9PLEO|nr:uncharacterized protein N0V89_006685 [Didymosphaeria variabile]KAJ4351345.1 hypothetical protein N0V89_006685 [Didymosphaeria variabile]
MSSTKNRHIYRALEPNESRLVHLASGEHNDAIVCTLDYFDTRSPPTYEALSYVWGDPKITAPIDVNGHTLQVTTNLEVALRHLRLPKEDRVLWIDAIVINQLDLAERAQQVALMGDVYSKAASVRVWLGPADAYTTIIFEWIRGKKLRELYSLKFAWNLRAPLLEPRGGQQRSLCGSRTMYQAREIFFRTENSGLRWHLTRDIPLSISAFASVQLIRRDWFSRRWCIQELALAENTIVQCGAESVQSIDLADIISNFYTTRTEMFDFKFPDIAKLISKANAISNSGYLLIPSNYDRTPLTELLFNFRHWRNGDPKDTVYGLLAIAQHGSIAIEYTKSDIEVLIDVFNDNLYHAKHINLVGVPWAPNIPGLPSWIVPTEDGSRCKNEDRFLFELLDPVDTSSAPLEWTTNARIARQNEDALPPVAFPSYTLFANGITLEMWGEAAKFSDEDFPPGEFKSTHDQFAIFKRDTRQQYEATRELGDRVVVLFGCNHILLLRPVEVGFTLVEVWLGRFWIVIHLDYYWKYPEEDTREPFRRKLKELLRASPTETFAIV